MEDEYITFDCCGQTITRDFLTAKVRGIGSDKAISRAFRVYNHDNNKQTLPISYFIHVWVKDRFIPAY